MVVPGPTDRWAGHGGRSTCGVVSLEGDTPPYVLVRRRENPGPDGTIYLTVTNENITDHIIISDGSYHSYLN